MTTVEAASNLNISVESLRRLVRRKAISYVAVLPSEYRFKRDDLDDYIARLRVRCHPVLVSLAPAGTASIKTRRLTFATRVNRLD
jgi:excisionase family DNA binding protein